MMKKESLKPCECRLSIIIISSLCSCETCSVSTPKETEPIIEAQSFLEEYTKFYQAIDYADFKVQWEINIKIPMMTI